jgi:hypothetical protein
VGLAFLSLATLSACGVAAGDAEQAITDHSHGRLSEPECDEFDTDFEETSFECSAARPGGHRIKLTVDFSGKGGDPLILEWPCLSAGMRWKATQKPALRCGRPLPQGG